MTADEQARRRIVHSLDETLFVEAGAGTGKTTQLVGRIVALVTRGRAPIESVAAITFTEAAAGELRDRISEAFERIAAGETGGDALLQIVLDDLDEAGRSLARERAAEALESLDAAAITTLHGFARRILSEHPFEAGLPPAFEVSDELIAEVEFSERWSAFLADFVEDPSYEEALVRASVCGVTLEELFGLARDLTGSWDLLEDSEVSSPPLGTVDATGVLDPLVRARSMCSFCTDDEDLLLDHLRTVSGFTDRLAAACSPTSAGDLETLLLLSSAPKLSCRLGKKGSWSGRVEDVRDLLSAASTEVDAILRRTGTDALGGMLVALRDFTLLYAGERRRQGRLFFHDLLAVARDLVRTSEEARRALHDQYRHILIDEFQDTDPIQAELAVRIAAGDGGGTDVPWQDLRPEAGRLFFVGDPKQSIYRFRRADVRLFSEVGRNFTAGVERLVRNHRSVPAILDWVNGVLGELIGDGDEGQPAYTPLVAHRTGAASLPVASLPVAVVGDVVDGSISDVRRAEAADIAATILEIRAERWPVGDAVDGEARPVRLSDICILIPQRTVLPPLEEALDAAGIPYRLEASTLVYASREVRELHTVLKAVDDPTDMIAVVGALRSGLFCCGDDDLLRFHNRQATWDYRVPPPEDLGANDPVASAMARLSELHDARVWREPGQLVDEVVDGCRMMQAALDTPRYRETWRRLRFVADQARRYCDAGGSDLRGYLGWVATQSGEDARVEEVVLPEADYDGVRIMTVHKAKGLEFPVVILAGLNIGSSPGRAPRLLWGQRGPEVSLGRSVHTPGFDVRREQEQRFDDYEAVRLLYVAATRARDHLVVSLHRKDGMPCAAAELSELCAGFPHLWRALKHAIPPPGGRDETDRGPARPGDDAFLRQRFLEQRRLRLAEAELPPVVAATAVAEMAALARRPAGSATSGRDVPPGTRPVRVGGGDELESADLDGVGHAPRHRGRAGTGLGRAVHAVLQIVDLATGEGIREIARAEAEAERIGSMWPEVERLARAALNSDVVARAAAGRHWREVYVGAPVGERALEGIVDLLVEGSEGYEIVDYKTDALSDADDLSRSLARYRPQGAAYALAVETVLGRPVTRCTFLFLRSGTAVGADVDDLGEAVEEVRRLLAHPPGRALSSGSPSI